jgi:hypothetical protein
MNFAITLHRMVHRASERWPVMPAIPTIVRNRLGPPRLLLLDLEDVLVGPSEYVGCVNQFG